MVRGWASYDSWRLASPYDGNGEWEKALEWAWEAWEEVSEDHPEMSESDIEKWVEAKAETYGEY